MIGLNLDMLLCRSVSGGGGAAPLLPSGLQMALLPSGIAESGGLLTGWTDASGNGNHITSLPLAPDVETFDGVTWVNFQSGGHYFDLPAGLTYDSQDYGLYVICQVPSDNSINYMVTQTTGPHMGLRHLLGTMPSGLSDYQLSYIAGGGFVTPATIWAGGGWSLTGLECSSTEARLVQDGEVYTGVAPASTTGTDGVFGKRDGTTSNYFEGKVMAIFAFAGEPTPAQLSELREYCIYNFGVGSGSVDRRVWVADGDSLTAGLSKNDAYWPVMFAKQFVGGALGVPKIRNMATAGDTTTQVLAGQAAVDSYLGDQTRFSSTGVILWAGTNDLSTSVALGTIQSNISTYVSNRQSAGHTVAVVTVLPQSGVSGANETNRAALNAWINAGSSGADIVVNLDTVAELQDYTDTDYFLGDEVHLTPLGSSLVAEAIYNAGVQ